MISIIVTENPIGYLYFDFENLDERCIYKILNELHSSNSSTLCHEDIEMASRELISRLDIVNYNLSKKENKDLVLVIKKIYGILCSIIPHDIEHLERETIRGKFNEYIKGEVSSPVFSPSNSPHSKAVKIPQTESRVEVPREEESQTCAPQIKLPVSNERGPKIMKKMKRSINRGFKK